MFRPVASDRVTIDNRVRCKYFGIAFLSMVPMKG